MFDRLPNLCCSPQENALAGPPLSFAASSPPAVLAEDLHDPDPQRKSRQNFSSTQLAILEVVFNTTPLPRKNIRAQLAEQLGLPQRSVQVWFQNRRQKWKSSYRASLITAVQRHALAEAERGGAPTPQQQPDAGSQRAAAAAPAAAAGVAGGPGLVALQLRWQEQWGAHVQAQIALQEQQRAPPARPAAPPPARSGASAPGAPREACGACEGLLLLSSCAQLAPASPPV